jgi:hypothetical protein
MPPDAWPQRQPSRPLQPQFTSLRPAGIPATRLGHVHDGMDAIVMSGLKPWILQPQLRQRSPFEQHERSNGEARRSRSSAVARDPALSMLIGELGAAVSASFSLVSCGHCVGSVGSFGPPARADPECAPRREVNLAALQACAVYDRQAMCKRSCISTNTFSRAVPPFVSRAVVRPRL